MIVQAMEVSDIAVLVGTFGGLQGIVETVKWWLGRKVQTRRDVADVAAKEGENYRKQVDWLEKRVLDRDAKIDRLYAELRQEQAARLDEMHKRHAAELALAEAEVKKCHKRRCPDREPPSDY